jgi:O-antigen/teichoic acid export membrane protein
MNRPRHPSDVRGTAVINMAATLLSAGTGVLLARWLGPAGRGIYAAATAYFGLSLIIFELGLASAVVYFVSRFRYRADDYVSTGTVLLIPLAIVAGLVSVVLALTEMGTSDTRMTFLILPVCIVMAFLGAPSTFALQALDIGKWNLIRIIQPIVFLPLIIGTFLITRFDVSTVVMVLALSLLFQALLARLLYVGLREMTGKVAWPTAGRMLRYGVPNMVSTVPNTINGRFDQLVLAFLVPAAALGQYAVAVTLSVLAGPLAMAFGNVAFPQLAEGGDPATTIRHAARGAMAVSALGEVAIVIAAPFVVPRLFGEGFADVTTLLLVLAPGAVLVVVNQVLGDLLRGLGRPGLVARCEWIGVIGTVAGLAITVPIMGTYGAALTSTIVYSCVHVLLRHSLHSAVAQHVPHDLGGITGCAWE